MKLDFIGLLTRRCDYVIPSRRSHFGGTTLNKYFKAYGQYVPL